MSATTAATVVDEGARASAPAPTKEAVLALLERDPIPVAEVAAALDAMMPEARITAIRAIPGRLQARLFDAAEAGTKAAPLALTEFVPAATHDMTFVRHYGKNSLPLFTHFEKRFCRPAPQHVTEGGRPLLYGYNHQALDWVTGPGCMVAYTAEGGEVWVDYRELPKAMPVGWPAVRPNDRGIAKLVYGDMVDRMRRVSKHVTIGRAWRHGKPEGNYFLLCREGA